METVAFLILLAVLLVLTGPLALILGVARDSTWRERVEQLEARIKALEGRITAMTPAGAKTSAQSQSRAVSAVSPAGALGAPVLRTSAQVASASDRPMGEAVLDPLPSPLAAKSGPDDFAHSSASRQRGPTVAPDRVEARDRPATSQARPMDHQPPARMPAQVVTTAAALQSSPFSAELLASSLFRLLSKNPFASAGMLLLLVGVGFLFALLASRNILPPIARVSLVALAGFAVFGFGIKVEKKRSALAFNLQGGAIAVEFLSALWAYDDYHLLTSSKAFLVLGLISLLAYVWAAYRTSIGHAFIGLLGALATPIVTSTGQGTISSLVLYCVWISALSIGCGAILGSTMLATVAMAGIIVLLEVARASNPGDLHMLVAGCVVISLAYCSSALVWCFKNGKFADFERASLLLQLIAPPLVLCQFIVQPGDVALADAALLPACTAALLLAAAWRVDREWRVWLLAVASVLGFVGITLHFEGGSQAVSFSAGAMGLVLIATAVRSPIIKVLALCYWLASIVVGFDQLQSHHTMPLDVSTAVALAAAYLERASLISILYLLGAPLLAASSTLDRVDVTIPHILWFMLAWTALALVVSRLVAWKELTHSTLWVVPAGLAMLFSSEQMGPGNLWALREATLMVWLAASAGALWPLLTTLTKDKSASIREDAIVLLSALIPVCISIEVIHAFATVLTSESSVIAAALALVWSLAAWASRLHRACLSRDRLGRACLFLALLLAGSAALVTPLQISHELILVLAITCAIGFRRFAELRSRDLSAVPETITLVLFAAGLALQLIGLHDALDESVLFLLVERDMQPWVSLLWALSGVVIVVIGSTQKNRSWWIAGAIGLMGLIAKMFVIDLAALTLPARVGTFMLVGVLFIVLGYFCPLPPALRADRGTRVGADGEAENGAEAAPV
jgi:hypothetical protein